MTETSINSPMTIRRFDLTELDREAVERLAERDSAATLEAPVIGIEVEGRLLAAASLSSGAMVADPFSRSDELRAMLALRAAQLARREPGSRRGLRLPRRRPRLALAGGPPGSIATLPR
jgi:hypothetical protein